MAELGSINGTVLKTVFRTPKVVGAGYICHAEKVYVVWQFDKADTGYIIYRDGVEIFNGKINDFDNAGYMFSTTDHLTNLFTKTRDRLMFIDENIKKNKTYNYSVQAYRTLEDKTNILSGVSNEYSIKTE